MKNEILWQSDVQCDCSSSPVSILENLVIETVLKYSFRHYFYFIQSYILSQSVENRREYVFFGNDDNDSDSDFPDCMRATDVTRAITTKNQPTNTRTYERTNEQMHEQTKYSERKHICGKGGKCALPYGDLRTVCLPQEKMWCSKMISPNFENHIFHTQAAAACWMACVWEHLAGRVTYLLLSVCYVWYFER